MENRSSLRGPRGAEKEVDGFDQALTTRGLPTCKLDGPVEPGPLAGPAAAAAAAEISCSRDSTAAAVGRASGFPAQQSCISCLSAAGMSAGRASMVGRLPDTTRPGTCTAGLRRLGRSR